MPSARDRKLHQEAGARLRVNADAVAEKLNHGVAKPSHRKRRNIITLAQHHVLHPKVVHDEAKGAGIHLGLAVAILQQETGIPQLNIFGCDCSATPCFCHQAVTQERIKQLLASPYANGVGWTQLTYKPFVQQAQAMGGAEKVRYQMRVGFQALSHLIASYGLWAGVEHYNGTGPAAVAYANEVIARMNAIDTWFS